MRNFFIAVAILACSTAAHAQFGIKGGFNFANFRGDDADGFNVQTSWHIGALYEVNIAHPLYFQPELLYSVHGAKRRDTEYKLNYFSVPLMFKLYPTEGFNIQLGPQLGMLIGESKEFGPYNSETFDFGLAAGLEFFVTDGIFLQARYYSGSKNVSNNRNFEIKNTNVSASVGFMF